MKITCFHCGQAVSTEVPDSTVFRAVAECPECVEKSLDYEQALAAKDKQIAALGAEIGVLKMGFKPADGE